MNVNDLSTSPTIDRKARLTPEKAPSAGKRVPSVPISPVKFSLSLDNIPLPKRPTLESIQEDRPLVPTIHVSDEQPGDALVVEPFGVEPVRVEPVSVEPVGVEPVDLDSKATSFKGAFQMALAPVSNVCLQ
jgi:hypothetical protein